MKFIATLALLLGLSTQVLAATPAEFQEVSEYFDRFASTVDEDSLSMDEYHAMGALYSAIESQDVKEIKDANHYLFKTLYFEDNGATVESFYRLAKLIAKLEE